MDPLVKAFADMFSEENDEIVLFARNKEGSWYFIEDDPGDLCGLVILIELYAQRAGLSFSDAVERIRRTRLLETTDWYIKNYVKEPE